MFNEVKYSLKMKRGLLYAKMADSQLQNRNYPSAIDYICRAENYINDAYSMACNNKGFDIGQSYRAMCEVKNLKANILYSFNLSISENKAP